MPGLRAEHNTSASKVNKWGEEESFSPFYMGEFSL